MIENLFIDIVRLIKILATACLKPKVNWSFKWPSNNNCFTANLISACFSKAWMLISFCLKARSHEEKSKMSIWLVEMKAVIILTWWVTTTLRCITSFSFISLNSLISHTVRLAENCSRRKLLDIRMITFIWTLKKRFSFCSFA